MATAQVVPPPGEATGSRRRPAPGVWWLSPAGAVLLIVPVTLGFATAYSPQDFLTYFRTPKSLTSATALLFAAGALVLVLGTFLTQVGQRGPARPGRWPWLSPAQLDTLERCSTVLFRVTVIGYLSFLVAAARNGVSPGDVVSAVLAQDVSSGELESTIGTIPGITTLTQVGVAYGVVAALVLTDRVDRRTVLRLAALTLMSLLRAYVFTERLALVEVVVPALVVLVVRASHTRSSSRRFALGLAPLPLVVLLVLGFAASEYSRSYQFFQTRTNDGLVLFSAKRLSGYYATAYNNGQIGLTYDNYPGRLPYTSLEAVWTAPLVEQAEVYDRLVGRDSSEHYQALLRTYGNPEFNNPGGLPAPFIDFGRVGGLLVLLGMGLAVGTAYRAFLQGKAVGVLIYPVVVTGLFELPRFLYWTLGRTVPTVLALLLVAGALNRCDRRAPALRL